MRISKTILDRFQELDRHHFEKIRDSEFKPAFDLPGLKYLRDKAGHERDMRELYRHRAPYELLQNADDADAKQVAYVLSKDGVAFAHDGSWFTVDNFRSLADGWSDKKPGECIGHKGIGFRSVLDITPAPHLLRVDPQRFFAVKFGWTLNHNHIQQTLVAKPDLRPRYESWQKPGQLVCPIMAIPGLARKQGLGSGAILFDDLARGHYGDDYTTMFWFPAEDAEIDRRTLEDLSPTPLVSNTYGRNTLLDFLRYEVSQLLPFLASVERVSLWDKDECLGSVQFARGADGAASEVAVHVDARGETHTRTYFQMQFTFGIPPQISGQRDTPKAVKAMRVARVVLLVRLAEGQPEYRDGSRFHVYFPTEEKTGLGFVVHGDFHVKPDRTRLMKGAYNDWLLGKIAKVVANEFLSELLDRYGPRAVFEALSPADGAATPAARQLAELVSDELKKRRLPFVPTAAGVVRQQDAVVPPVADRDGFWDAHFSATLEARAPGELVRGFVRSGIDTPRVRAFLRSAGVQELEPEDLLVLMETAAHSEQSSQWWHECYAYLSSERSRLAGRAWRFFRGRRLLPADDGTIVGVPDEGEHIMCLPPARGTSTLSVPRLFSNVFEFLSLDVAQALAVGSEDVQDWVLSHLRVTRFEATDLLPRAVRSTVPGIYSGETAMTTMDLREAWLFIKAVIDSSRAPITSPDFIQELGRFPVPLEVTEDRLPGAPARQVGLTPAFLAFWPEQVYGQNSCLAGIDGLRRMAYGFLQDVITASERSRDDWLHFFKMLGVSASHKLLEYRRLAVGGQDLAFTPRGPRQAAGGEFTGERQNDENRAFAQAVVNDSAWPVLVDETRLCGHDGPKVLGSMPALEGLAPCVHQAETDYTMGDPSWRSRLWRLVRDLATIHAINSDPKGSVFCRAGGRGGHSIPARSLVETQLQQHKWLPTTLGPANVADSFARLTTRHLISLGRQTEGLGDLLLPYVVIDTIDEEARLQRLGVEVLEDSASASSQALVRALQLLGEQLSSEWGQEEIVAVRGRWRLVRGAIQDVYRALNQRDILPGFGADTKFAVRAAHGTSFEERPLYYAEPGSPLEQAFVDIVPLIDTDRRYRALFDMLGVVPLITGETVNEDLLSKYSATQARRMQHDIIENLAPYLMAAVLAKSRTESLADTIVRRLRERFTVQATDALTVRFSLTANPKLGRTIQYPKFYLQRRLAAGPGAIQEAYYTLFFAGSPTMSLLSPGLDADALGTALAPLFADDISEELAGLFPRIVSRYHHRQADAVEISAFLYNHLGISRDAQDLAQALVSGEAIEVLIVKPPPARIVPAIHQAPGSGPTTLPLEARLHDHSKDIGVQMTGLQQEVLALAIGVGERPESGDRPDTRPLVRKKPSGAPTTEQQARGKQGEEEIKRRLEGEVGWERFALVRDARDEGCGYDFLCECGGRTVFLEIKTFTRNGYVSVTNLELQVAASEQDDYYLVGVLADDSQSPRAWQTSLVRNPITVLLADGTFRIQAELRASASRVFDLEGLLGEPMGAEGAEEEELDP